MPLPAPLTWEDGEDAANIPDAADLNLDWRDSLEFYLGTTRPIFYGWATASQSLTAGVAAAITIQDEKIKRGGMVHSNSTNPSRITVPYSGQYQGLAMVGSGTLASIPARLTTFIMRNGSEISRCSIPATTTNFSEVSQPFTANLDANDYVELWAHFTVNGPTSNNGSTNSRIAIWYVGDY